jgi:hypothetical protein
MYISLCPPYLSTLSISLTSPPTAYKMIHTISKNNISTQINSTKTGIFKHPNPNYNSNSNFRILKKSASNTWECESSEMVNLEGVNRFLQIFILSLQYSALRNIKVSIMQTR